MLTKKMSKATEQKKGISKHNIHGSRTHQKIRREEAGSEAKRSGRKEDSGGWKRRAATRPTRVESQSN